MKINRKQFVYKVGITSNCGYGKHRRASGGFGYTFWPDKIVFKEQRIKFVRTFFLLTEEANHASNYGSTHSDGKGIGGVFDRI